MRHGQIVSTKSLWRKPDYCRYERIRQAWANPREVRRTCVTGEYGSSGKSSKTGLLEPEMRRAYAAGRSRTSALPDGREQWPGTPAKPSPPPQAVGGTTCSQEMVVPSATARGSPQYRSSRYATVAPTAREFLPHNRSRKPDSLIGGRALSQGSSAPPATGGSGGSGTGSYTFLSRFLGLAQRTRLRFATGVDA
jgi:hypothetical protein